jgi:hypothetical protein
LNVASELEVLFNNKVTPGVEAALAARRREAWQMSNEHPDFPIYGNVTLELDDTWSESGIAGTETDRGITDVRFIDLVVSLENISKEETIKQDDHSLLGVKTYYRTKRVTYSVKVDFGETPEQYQWRVFLKDAENAASRGLSARQVAGGTHFGEFGRHWSLADEREEQQRAKFRLRGEPSLREQYEREDRKLWVRAYLYYTYIYGPEELYLDALQYLAELDQSSR